MANLKIPYESLDPLTIGAADDETKVYREELELEIPDANLMAAIYPDEPAPVPDATEAAARRSRTGQRPAVRAADRGRQDRSRS